MHKREDIEILDSMHNMSDLTNMANVYIGCTQSVMYCNFYGSQLIV